MRADLAIAFLVGAVVATGLVFAAAFLVRRERRAARSAVSDLREEWLEPFADHLLTLTEEQRENARQVDQMHTGVGDVHQKLDELGRRFLAVRGEIRRLADDALQAGYRQQLGLSGSTVLPGKIYAADPVAADRILSRYLRAARALDLQTSLLTLADGGRHIRLWLRRKTLSESPENVDRRIESALEDVLTWRDDVEARRRAAEPSARALADTITSLGAHGDCFVQLGRAVFVTANGRIAVAVLNDQDLAYLEEHPDLVSAPGRALARMRATMRDRYLDLTPTLRALTGPPQE